MISHRSAPGETDTVVINVERWRRVLPAAAWPRGFAECGAARRSDVFAIADHWRAGAVSASQLVTAVLAWG